MAANNYQGTNQTDVVLNALKDIKNYFGNMMDAVIELSNDPKYQKLGIDPNNLLSHTAAPTPTEIEKKTLRRNRD